VASDEEKVLSVGDTAPEFELPDSSGVPRRLCDMVANGPRVFVFYRGHW